MPDRYLASGAMIVCSEEDVEVVDGATWRVWVLKGKPRVVWDKMSRGQRYRLHLHREVAFRMRPDLVKKADRVQVIPRNDDFLDVRRENLEIICRPRKRAGPPKRPTGYRAKGGRNSAGFRGVKACAEPPPWSRIGSRTADVRRDGSGGPDHAPHPGERGEGS